MPADSGPAHDRVRGLARTLRLVVGLLDGNRSENQPSGTPSRSESEVYARAERLLSRWEGWWRGQYRTYSEALSEPCSRRDSRLAPGRPSLRRVAVGSILVGVMAARFKVRVPDLTGTARHLTGAYLWSSGRY